MTAIMKLIITLGGGGHTKIINGNLHYILHYIFTLYIYTILFT
jgi:hypothetical protein